MAFPNSFTTDTTTSGDCKTKRLQIQANPWGCGLSHQGNSGGYAVISAVVQIYILLTSRNVEHLFTCSLTIWGVPVQLFWPFFFTGIYLFLIRHNSPFWFFSRDLKSLEHFFFFKLTEVTLKFPAPLLFLPNQRNRGWERCGTSFSFSHQCFNLVAHIWNQLKVKRETMSKEVRQANSESWPLISWLVCFSEPV